MLGGSCCSLADFALRRLSLRSHIEARHEWLYLQSPGFEISLCNPCVLCVSVVCFCTAFINHKDTENPEAAQRRAAFRLLGQAIRVVHL
jgi:hypothetical protein